MSMMATTTHGMDRVGTTGIIIMITQRIMLGAANITTVGLTIGAGIITGIVTGIIMADTVDTVDMVDMVDMVAGTADTTNYSLKVAQCFGRLFLFLQKFC